MANIGYYGHEVTDLLGQVRVNESDIGMNRINILPVPDGEWETIYKRVPSSMDLTVSGNKRDGVITVSVNGTAPNPGEGVPYAHYVFLKLTPNAAEDSAGILAPGTYLLSLDGSDSVADMPWELPGTTTWYPRIQVDVHREDGFSSYGARCFGEPNEFIVPENYTSVEFSLWLNYGYFTDVTASCELYPFLRLKAHENYPFEPYKPSLQEQIDSISDSVAPKLLQLTDTLCLKRSTNLFPAKFMERTELEHTIGTYVMFKTLENYVDAVCFVGKEGTDAGTDLLEFFINVYPSASKAKDIIKRCTSLLPGTYVLSFEQDTELDDWDTAAGYATMEIHEDPQSGRMWTDDPATMIAETSGENVEFTVGDKPLAITIKMHRNEGMSWYQNGIVILPFLRRKENINAPRDSFVPSVEEQLKELYTLSGAGGYNETQTNAVTDEVREEEI